MICATNLAFGMFPGLSQGAYNALALHGSDEIKQRYLPKLADGSWAGTMCLTEPQCGTDLGLVRTQGRARARRQLPHHRRQDLHLGRRA